MKNLIIGIGGEPASGKSTVMWSFFNDVPDWKGFKFKKLRGYYSKSMDLYLLGIYNGALFQGTDKLSMTVAVDLYEFAGRVGESRILFEGDRLFSAKVLKTLEEAGSQVIKIVLTTTNQAERIVERGSVQTEQFKKAKATKIANMLRDDLSITVMPNETQSDLEAIKKLICKTLHQQN